MQERVRRAAIGVRRETRSVMLRPPRCSDRPHAGGLVAGLLAVALLGACGNTANRAADEPLPTTTVRVLDAALPSAGDLGASYEEVPVANRLAGACSFAIDEPTQRAERSFVSNAAQERIDLQVLRYEDDQTASAAFAAAQSSSSCRPSEFDDAGGRPTLVEIKGARASFDVGSTDGTDSVGFTVTLVGPTVIVVESRLHHGALAAEPLGGHEVAAQVIEGLR